MPKVTETQKQIIVEYMEDHPEFASGKLVKAHRKKEEELWAELVELLNASNGPVKSEKQWRRCWSDLKSASREKAAGIVPSKKKGPNGQPAEIKLSDIQSRILNIIKRSSQIEVKVEDQVQSHEVSQSINLDVFIVDSSVDHHSQDIAPPPRQDSKEIFLEPLEPVPSQMEAYNTIKKPGVFLSDDMEYTVLETVVDSTNTFEGIHAGAMAVLNKLASSTDKCAAVHHNSLRTVETLADVESETGSSVSSLADVMASLINMPE